MPGPRTSWQASSHVRRLQACSRPARFARPQSCNPLGFAQALDQGAAQQEGARKLGIFRGPPQLVVIALAYRGVLLRQQPLVADGLRLRVLQRDVSALTLVAVEHLLADFPPQDLGSFSARLNASRMPLFMPM